MAGRASRRRTDGVAGSRQIALAGRRRARLCRLVADRSRAVGRRTSAARSSEGAMVSMPDAMRFAATVELGGKTATGIEVPDDVIAALGSSSARGRRHDQRLRLPHDGGAHGGRFLVPLSAENRRAQRRLGRRRDRGRHRDGRRAARGRTCPTNSRQRSTPRPRATTTRCPTPTARSGCAGSKTPRSRRPDATRGGQDRRRDYAPAKGALSRRVRLVRSRIGMRTSRSVGHLDGAVVAGVDVPDHAHARDRWSAPARASAPPAPCRRRPTPGRRGSSGPCRRRRRGGSTPTSRRWPR